MTPNIRSSIPQFFPDHDAKEILSTLLETGRGLSHARSCVDYYLMLHCGRQDFELLKRLVRFSNREPRSFQEYISRYAHWKRLAESVGQIDYLRFFSPIVQKFAIEGSQYQISWLASHYTICMSRTNAHPEPNDLYFVPIIETGVFISTDPEAYMLMKTTEIVEHCEGELTPIAEAPIEMLKAIDSLFEKDASIGA